MKSFKEYLQERMTDAEHDDIDRRKEGHKKDAERKKERLAVRKTRYKKSP